MVNVSSLAAEIISLFRDTPANFNRFRVLASLLQRRRSTEVNQTFFPLCLAISWVGTLYRLSGAVYIDYIVKCFIVIMLYILTILYL